LIEDDRNGRGSSEHDLTDDGLSYLIAGSRASRSNDKILTIPSILGIHIALSIAAAITDRFNWELNQPKRIDLDRIFVKDI
jgi:hypothetical protein